MIKNKNNNIYFAYNYIVIHTLLIRTCFSIMACIIAYVTPIRCMTFSCIHLVVQTS